MRNKIRPTMASILLGFGLATLPYSAHALTVHDPTHTAETIANGNTMVEQLQEAQKTFNETKKIATKVGGLAAGFMNPDALLAHARQSMTCLLPDLSQFTLPDDFRPSFISICEAKDSIEKMVFPAEDGEIFDGKTLSATEEIAAVNGRRDALLRQSVIEALAAAAHSQQTGTQSNDVATDIITDTSANPDLDALMAQNNRALAAILTELSMMRNLLSTLVEVQAASQLDRLPTRVKLSPEVQELAQ